jgi:hypothetical protein
MQSKATLEAGSRAMRANLGYCVGADRKNNRANGNLPADA